MYRAFLDDWALLTRNWALSINFGIRAATAAQAHKALSGFRNVSGGRRQRQDTRGFRGASLSLLIAYRYVA